MLIRRKSFGLIFLLLGVLYTMAQIMMNGFSVPLEKETIEGSDELNPVDETPEVNSNDAAQWSLNAIEIMAMCPEVLPYDMPEASSHHSRHFPPGGGVRD